MALKNNKIKNTGLLFEMLIKQITEESISNSEPKAILLVKKYFYNTELAKESKLYNSLINSSSLSESEASLLLNEALNAHKTLNKKQLANDKYNLIKEMKQKYSDTSVLKTKVDNYSVYASIYNIFESNLDTTSFDIVDVVRNKTTLLEHLTKKIETNPLKEIYEKSGKLTRKLLTEATFNRFNQKFVNLNESQKEIVSNYAKNTLTEQMLKENLENVINTIKEKSTETDNKEIINKLTTLKECVKVDDSTVEQVLFFNELLNELKSI